MINGITVVICTYNGEARLAKTLSCCIAQHAVCSWELLVIDNASTDNTATFCRTFLELHAGTTNWSVLTEEQPGLNFARLRGLREAKFDVVLFCDDDNGLDANYVQTGFELMNTNQSIGALGGNGSPVFESEKPGWFDTYAHSFAVGPQAEFNGKLNELPAEVYGAGCFYRKAPLLRFFNEGYKAIMTDRIGKSLASGGDVEWCYLVQLAGMEVWYSDQLRFTHQMSANRMQWNYYLRLKAGIASGSARLLPYNVLLRNPQTGVLKFTIKWMSHFSFCNLAYIKFSLQHIFRRKKLLPNEEIAWVRLKARSRAFWRDPMVAIRHFKQLKMAFSETDPSKNRRIAL